jgi:hypothetical protein
VCSWRTFKTGYLTPGVTKENARGNSVLVTNPISWTTDHSFVGRTHNKGAVLTKFNKIFPTPADAQISNGVLFTEKPRFPWSFLFKPVIIILEIPISTISMYGKTWLPVFVRFKSVSEI